MGARGGTGPADVDAEGGGAADQDEPLLRQFLAGDPSACRRVERWAWEIVHFRFFAIPKSEREDAVQDAVGDLWRALSVPGFRLRAGLRPLVRQIAAARCIDRMRRRRPTASLDESIADPSPGPYEALLRSDESARVRWAIQNLEEKCREIIRLHFLEEQPYAAIAAREERSEATMRVRMFHCLKGLRAMLSRWER